MLFLGLYSILAFEFEYLFYLVGVIYVDLEFLLGMQLCNHGSAAFPASMWTHTRGQAKGSHSTDVHAHDCTNSVKKAAVATVVEATRE